jgi:hypothetical protein
VELARETSHGAASVASLLRISSRTGLGSFLRGAVTDRCQACTHQSMSHLD